MIGGVERTQRLTQVQGVAAVGFYLFVSFLFVCLSFSFHLSAGMKGSGGELRHLAPPEAEGVLGPVIL
jgi:hypothetical protein